MPVGLRLLQRVDVLRPQLSASRARGGGRGHGADRGAERVPRRRRGVHPSRAWLRDRQRDRAARHPEAVLPRDPVRRAAAEPRGLRVLASPRAPLSLPRSRGDRRRGPQAPPEARVAVGEPRGARGRAGARADGRDQHHRRSRLGRAALRDHPRVGAKRAGDRAPHGQHAVSGHRDVAHGIPQAHLDRLPAVRRAARRAADPPAAAALLRGAGAHASGAESEAPRHGDALGRPHHRRAPRRSRPDPPPPATLRPEQLYVHAPARRGRSEPAARTDTVFR